MSYKNVLKVVQQFVKTNLATSIEPAPALKKSTDFSTLGAFRIPAQIF